MTAGDRRGERERDELEFAPASLDMLLRPSLLYSLMEDASFNPVLIDNRPVVSNGDHTVLILFFKKTGVDSKYENYELT